MIEVEDIYMSFGDNQVLQGISGTFKPGLTNLIIGGSGSGKTTALMTMAGLLPPVAGTVRVGAVDISDIDPAELRRHVGYFA
ncbi:MAG: ATP-binding cassette domain-containing protein, partial [Sphingobacteriales bacterium]